VHVPTFLAGEWTNLFDMRFGGGWRNELLNEEFWQQIDHIPDHSYWSLRQSLKAELQQEVRERARFQHRRNGWSDTQIERYTRFLAPQETDMLIIGFARRFATYKRATLLFADPERLARLLNNPQQPVLLVFAGKAHPHDRPGQELIRTIHEFSRRPEFEGRIILLEGYDLSLARRLVTGVDVWVNTPQYPLEASGTSGQKAAINGVINLSVLDGWWGEGYNGENGWAITPHAPHHDAAYRDWEEGQELMDILEKQVVPLYYARNGYGYSEAWVKKSKASMKSIMPRFNAQRMVMDYARNYYHPARQQRLVLSGNDCQRARELATWRKNIDLHWPNVRLRRVDEAPDVLMSGDVLSMRVAARLAGLQTDDVLVECLVGTLNERGDFEEQYSYVFTSQGGDNDETQFRLDLRPKLSGLQYYKIRMFPFHVALSHRYETGYMLWL
jgi:starch phosphorylase